MKALNIFLALFVSALMAALAFEGGLRLLVLSPERSILEFDSHAGWRKKADTAVRRKSKEYDVTIRTNALGLADDPMSSPAKPAGKFRVVVLGDSFTQGFSVDRKDLFVDLLEKRWNAEGRDVDVVNAGTQGWSTDQEVVWLLDNGAQFKPDVVLLAAYENDIFWNGSPTYEYRETQKPEFDGTGKLLTGELVSVGPKPWTENWSTTLLAKALFGPKNPDYYFTPERAGGPISREFAPLLNQEPAFLRKSMDGTRGALASLKNKCVELGARPLLIALPSHSAVDSSYAPKFAKARLRGLSEIAWSADKPVETFLTLAKDVGIEALDPRAALRTASTKDHQLFFNVDWHLNANGNRVLAGFLHDEFERLKVFPADHAQKTAIAAADLDTQPPQRAPKWPFVFAGLWVALSSLYLGTYKDDRTWRAPLKVGAMLAAVFTIVLGGGKLIALLPPGLSAPLAVLFVLGVLTFVAYKLGRRLATIAELLRSFVLRGHWYLMPLLVVLLSIGSLLVVAASSPLIAPFIYTLF